MTGLPRLSLLALLMAAPAAAQPNSGPPAVGVVHAARVPITETNEFIGRVEAVDHVALVARVTAFLEQRLFTEGSDVQAGDVLYKLEEGPFQADFMAKQAALGQQNALLLNLNQTLGRQQALINTPAGQRSNLDNAIAQQRSGAAQVLAAQANLATSKINLDYTTIKAPITGRITRTNVTAGNVVGPTSGTLATIVSQDPMYIVFPVSSRSALDLRQRYAGAGGLAAVRVRVRLPTGQIYAQDGKLDYVDPTVSANTDTLTARAVVANPPIGEPGPQGTGPQGTGPPRNWPPRNWPSGKRQEHGARADRRRVRAGSGAGADTDRGAWRAAGGHPVGPAGRLRVHGGCPEPCAADARAARPVHAERGGGDERAQRGAGGDHRGNTAGEGRGAGGAWACFRLAPGSR